MILDLMAQIGRTSGSIKELTQQLLAENNQEKTRLIFQKVDAIAEEAKHRLHVSIPDLDSLDNKTIESIKVVAQTLAEVEMQVASSDWSNPEQPAETLDTLAEKLKSLASWTGDEIGRRITRNKKIEQESNENSQRLHHESKAHAKVREETKKFVEKSTWEFESLRDRLVSSLSDFEGTVSRYKAQEEKLDKVLSKSSKVGLSAGFKQRASELEKLKKFWVGILLLVLGIMYCGGLDLVDAIKSGADWKILVARALLATPLIWGGWFAAKQFGYTSRLQEDYEFKVASAMSFEGYKIEAAAVGDPMLQKLIETAISNLSESPLRIYNIASDPGTPAQEILESLAKTSALAEAISKFKNPA